MDTGAWTLRSRRVVTPAGIRPADVAIRAGRIVAVASHDDRETEGVVLDSGDRLVLPGLVDLSANRGDQPARAGSSPVAGQIPPGVTTQIDPAADFGLIPFDAPAFLAGVNRLSGTARVDRGFLGVLGLDNARGLDALLDAGVFGIKARLGQAGGEGLPVVAEPRLRPAMATLARSGRPLVAALDRSVRAPGFLGGRFLATDPSVVTGSIRLLINLCRETGCRVHLAHLAAPDVFPLIARAQDEGLPVSVGVAASDLLPGKEPRFGEVSADPEEVDRLWDGLRSGVIAAISLSDSRGVPTSPLAVWDEAHRRRFGPDDLARWLALRPAELIGLAGRKGAIAPGFDADLVVFSDGVESRPTRVVATFLRGVKLPSPGQTPTAPFRGEMLLRLEETVPDVGGLERLNGLPEAAAIEVFRGCCASTRWAWRMAALRPFASEFDLLGAADRVWAALGRADRLEAYAGPSWLADAEASTATRAALDDGRQAYERKFGHHFLVDPAVRVDDAILDSLWRRLSHAPEVEQKVAAEEQVKITRHALRRLLS